MYIGVGHGGSTTLMDRLAAHPQVAPNVVGLHKPWRETWYLSLAWPLVGPDEGAGNGEGGRSGGAVDPGAMPASVVSAARVGYATLFQRGLREAGGVLVSGEKTPSYWRFRGTATRLAAVAPGAKLLMLLRDPAEWIKSRWAQGKGLDGEAFTRAFNEALDDPNMPLYALCKDLPYGIADWLEHFPREALHVELTNALSDEPLEVMVSCRAVLARARCARSQACSSLAGVNFLKGTTPLSTRAGRPQQQPALLAFMPTRL